LRWGLETIPLSPSTVRPVDMAGRSRLPTKTF